MFGFQGGESTATVARKRGYMEEAQQLWPFLTNFDASTIKSEVQLIALVKEKGKWKVSSLAQPEQRPATQP